MKSDPFFSIVVPVYNRVDNLLTTISTILKQTYTDFELIIVDDGSTDGTPKIVKDHFSDTRIHILSQINSERGAARNNGFRYSKGQYVVFFDSDDLMHENHLQVFHDQIHKGEMPHFLANRFDFVSPEGKHSNSDMHNIQAGIYDYKLFLSGNPLACNVCVKKDTPDLILFEEDRRYAIKEDWMFLVSNMRKRRILISEQTTVSMLDHEQRSMRGDNSVIIARTKLAMQWITDKVNLTVEEQRQLKAHVNYFCGIHSYLDNNRKDAVNYSQTAMRFGGYKMKYIVLLLKSIVGRKIVKAIT